MLTKSAGARAIAQYAQKKLNARSFGIIAPDSSYGDEVTRAFWDALDEGGSEVRAYEHYPQRTHDLQAVRLAHGGPLAADLDERKEFMEESQKIIESIQDPYKRPQGDRALEEPERAGRRLRRALIPDSARTIRLIAPAVAARTWVTSGCDQRELEVFKKTTKREDVRTVQLLEPASGTTPSWSTSGWAPRGTCSARCSPTGSSRTASVRRRASSWTTSTGRITAGPDSSRPTPGTWR